MKVDDLSFFSDYKFELKTAGIWQTFYCYE